MTNLQIFILIFTFGVGMMAGAYMYVTNFAPQYKSSEAQGTDATLTIIGEQVGGCQMAGVCASFRMESNRNFVYIPAHSLTNDSPEPISGRISSNVYRELQEILADSNIKNLQTEADECQAAFDGIDYEYSIVYDGDSFALNSCGTAFYGTRLYNQLLLLWGEMLRAEAGGSREGAGASDVIDDPERRGGGFLIDRFGP